VESTNRVYVGRLCFVSARTNKRHHHHVIGTAVISVQTPVVDSGEEKNHREG